MSVGSWNICYPRVGRKLPLGVSMSVTKLWTMTSSATSTWKRPCNWSRPQTTTSYRWPLIKKWSSWRTNVTSGRLTTETFQDRTQPTDPQSANLTGFVPTLLSTRQVWLLTQFYFVWIFTIREQICGFFLQCNQGLQRLCKGSTLNLMLQSLLV